MAAVLAAAALVWSAAAGAHFVERTDSLWGFVSRSDLIVIGTVLQSQRLEERGHTTAPGAVRLRVDERLLGEAAEPDVGILIEGMHQPAYAEGERVLVFAERKHGILRSIQDRAQKVDAGEARGPILEVVRRYVAIRRVADERRKLAALEQLTLELLRSPLARLHQDAVFDLSRVGLLDGAISRRDVRAIGSFALSEKTPLVVREGIAAKLGVLARAGRGEALAPLERLAVEPANAAVRVAAINALAATGNAEVARPLVLSLDAADVYVRLAAVDGLGTLRSAAAVGALSRRSGDPDARVRFAASKAIEKIGGAAARPVLDPTMKGTP